MTGHTRGTQVEPDRRSRLALASVLVALTPIVVAAGRALVGEWSPLGDNAYFTIRSRDVLGPHHPLVGAWSSGSAAIGTSVNNLGPLQLDLLAPFTKLAPAAGTAVGVALVNLAAVIGLALAVRKTAGTTALITSMAATAVLTWTMGSALVIEPRQHHFLMLPFLCYLVLCWAISSGDGWMMPWAAFVGSLLVQTHFSYLILAPLVGFWAVAMWALRARRRSAGARRAVVPGSLEPIDGDSEADSSEPRRRSRRTQWLKGAPIIATVVVLAICWAQTLIDQFFQTGNLGSVREAGAAGQPGAGLVTGARIVASVVAMPTSWLRDRFGDFDPAGGLLAVGWAGLAIASGALVMFVAAMRARRRGDRVAMLAVTTAAVAVTAGFIAAAQLPPGAFGVVSGNYRWLWPISAFASFAVVLGFFDPRPVQSRSGSAARGAIVRYMSAAVVVIVSALNLSASYQVPVVRDDRVRQPVAAALLDQLDDVELTEPVLFDRSRAGFGEPYAYAVLLDLQRRGIEFTFAAAVDAARFGSSRRDEGRAGSRLMLVTGPDAADPIAGATLIANAQPAGERDAADAVALFLAAP